MKKDDLQTACLAAQRHQEKYGFAVFCGISRYDGEFPLSSEVTTGVMAGIPVMVIGYATETEATEQITEHSPDCAGFHYKAIAE